MPKPSDCITVAEAREFAERIERFGAEHDRAIAGWGVPDNAIVVFRGGNITSSIPLSTYVSKEGRGDGN
jgi:hypothetical protein